MLEDIRVIFSEKDKLLKKLKKSAYENNMEYYLENYGHYFDEMAEYVSNASDATAAANEITEVFANDIFEAYSKNGKMNGRIAMDLNFVMIYYIFPGILKRNEENGKIICDALKDNWNQKFGCGIDYGTYEDILSGFRTKLFGLF